MKPFAQLNLFTLICFTILFSYLKPCLAKTMSPSLAPCNETLSLLAPTLAKTHAPFFANFLNPLSPDHLTDPSKIRRANRIIAWFNAYATIGDIRKTTLDPLVDIESDSSPTGRKRIFVYIDVTSGAYYETITGKQGRPLTEVKSLFGVKTIDSVTLSEEKAKEARYHISRLSAADKKAILKDEDRKSRSPTLFNILYHSSFYLAGYKAKSKLLERKILQIPLSLSPEELKQLLSIGAVIGASSKPKTAADLLEWLKKEDQGLMSKISREVDGSIREQEALSHLTHSLELAILGRAILERRDEEGYRYRLGEDRYNRIVEQAKAVRNLREQDPRKEIKSAEDLVTAYNKSIEKENQNGGTWTEYLTQKRDEANENVANTIHNIRKWTQLTAERQARMARESLIEYDTANRRARYNLLINHRQKYSDLTSAYNSNKVSRNSNHPIFRRPSIDRDQFEIDKARHFQRHGINEKAFQSAPNSNDTKYWID